MEEVLSRLRKRYGTPKEYLSSIGFGVEEQQRLRQVLEGASSFRQSEG